jgi:integrase
MASTVNKLSAAFVRNSLDVGRHNDGAGLYLQTSQIGDNITKAWLFRFKLNGRKREMGLGSVNTYNLAEAREHARQCRQLVHQGIDPIEHRKTQRAEARAETAKAMTFKQAMDGFPSDNRKSWRSAVHARQWRASLDAYAVPTLGALPVAAIETAHVVTVLRPIWSDKHVTASRVRGRIEVVLDWAKAGGFRSGENPARWKGHLENILPKHNGPGRKAVKHHAAMPYREVPDFMTKVADTQGTAARALEVLVLTAVRLDELIGMRCDEIDLGAALWTIPPERTKGHREHRVPLSQRAYVVLIAEAKRAAALGDKASPFVFPGHVSRLKPLGASTLQRALRDISGSDVTLHGFRSSFRDWCGDQTEVAREVAEAALGHIVGDKAERAYRRGDALDKRRQLMSDWATFCNSKLVVRKARAA